MGTVYTIPLYYPMLPAGLRNQRTYDIFVTVIMAVKYIMKLPLRLSCRMEMQAGDGG